MERAVRLVAQRPDRINPNRGGSRTEPPRAVNRSETCVEPRVSTAGMPIPALWYVGPRAASWRSVRRRTGDERSGAPVAGGAVAGWRSATCAPSPESEPEGDAADESVSTGVTDHATAQRSSPFWRRGQQSRAAFHRYARAGHSDGECAAQQQRCAKTERDRQYDRPHACARPCMDTLDGSARGRWIDDADDQRA